LFRFFKEPQWADKLASGEVFLSTLERCRQYEDPLQGDPGEGIHVRGLPDGYAVWGQPGAQELAAAHNFHLRPGSNIVFRGNTERVVVPDGWLLCLTTEDTPAIRETFGHHGVVINDPWRFFRTIHRSLSGNPSVWFAVFGPIIYEERSLPHVLEQPIHAMVKPEQYQHQAEVRMFWHPTAGTAVTEMTLNLPGAARYMTRLPNL
jgi:hypothetical protein